MAERWRVVIEWDDAGSTKSHEEILDTCLRRLFRSSSNASTYPTAEQIKETIRENHIEGQIEKVIDLG